MSSRPAFGDGANHVDRLIAIERRHLDRDDVLDLGKSPPERIRQHASADGGLKIEADDGDDARDGAGVIDELIFGCVAHRAEAQESRVIAEVAQQRRLARRLIGLTTNARDAHQRIRAGRVRASHLLGGELQYRREQSNLGIADLKLRRVHPDGKPTGAGGDVVTRQRALAALVELALRIQRKRVRRNDDTTTENLSKIRHFCKVSATHHE